MKILTTFVPDAIITSRKVKVLKEEKSAYKNIYNYKHFEREVHTEFLDDVSIAFIDKTDGSNPAKRQLLDPNPQNICTLRP